MSLEYVPDVRTGTGEVDNVTIDRHLYLTEAQDRVVEEGDPAGRWLWAAPGQLRPRADAARLGAIPNPAAQVLLDGGYDPEVVADEVKDSDSVDLEQIEAAHEAKAVKPAANKARKPAANKAKPAPEDEAA